LFERFDTTSAKEGASATRKDSFGQFFSGRPMVVQFNAQGEGDVEGFDVAKSAVIRQVQDPTARNILAITFVKTTLLNCAQLVTSEFGCIGGYAGKNPAASWKMDGGLMGARVKMDCAFSGWSKAGEKKVAIVNTVLPIQPANFNLQPGAKVAISTKGEGKSYFEPSNRETFSELKFTSVIPSPAPQTPELHGSGVLVAHVYAE
jgi:hypothetical protein